MLFNQKNTEAFLFKKRSRLNFSILPRDGVPSFCVVENINDIVSESFSYLSPEAPEAI